jgi:hypothetical protein
VESWLPPLWSIDLFSTRVSAEGFKQIFVRFILCGGLGCYIKIILYKYQSQNLLLQKNCDSTWNLTLDSVPACVGQNTPKHCIPFEKVDPTHALI